jgi:cytoskeletal protein RodZ
MSKKRKRRSRSSTGKQKSGSKSFSSLAIPIIVAAVVLVIIVGAIVSIEARQPDTSSPSVNTAQPLATSSISNASVPRISVQETKDKLDGGQAVLVDVRSKSSYDTLHAEGAVSIPEAEMGGRLDELPHDVDLVLY